MKTTYNITYRITLDNGEILIEKTFTNCENAFVGHKEMLALATENGGHLYRNFVKCVESNWCEWDAFGIYTPIK